MAETSFEIFFKLSKETKIPEKSYLVLEVSGLNFFKNNTGFNYSSLSSDIFNLTQYYSERSESFLCKSSFFDFSSNCYQLIDIQIRYRQNKATTYDIVIIIVLNFTAVMVYNFFSSTMRRINILIIFFIYFGTDPIQMLCALFIKLFLTIALCKRIF